MRMKFYHPDGDTAKRKKHHRFKIDYRLGKPNASYGGIARKTSVEFLMPSEFNESEMFAANDWRKLFKPVQSQASPPTAPDTAQQSPAACTEETPAQTAPASSSPPQTPLADQSSAHPIPAQLAGAEAEHP